VDLSAHDLPGLSLSKIGFLGYRRLPGAIAALGTSFVYFGEE
jgi:hypothetical protein